MTIGGADSSVLGDPVHQTGSRIGNQIGRYRLGPIIGRGGFGVVYESESDGMRVAVKLLRKGVAAEPQQRARLRQEAAVLQRLSHPHIARLLAVETTQDEDDCLALIMEFVDGVSLRQRIGRGAVALPIPLTLQLLGQVAAALAHAHGQGVVHRDIKPDNIMIVTVAGREEARVVDFGVAKAAAASSELHTRPQTGEGMLGTIAYMAPEQMLSARDVDGKADVFSLGVVLYEVLTGVAPYGADLPQWSIAAPAPPPPQERNSLLPAWLSLLVMSMLAKKPTRRPDMQQVAQALLPLSPGRCPFPGLEAFGEDQAAWFHGREREVAEAQALLGPGPPGYRRWLQIEGGSGSGKSSLLLAGLLPLWRREGIGGKATRVLMFRPGRDPLLNLAQALLHCWPAPGGLAATLARLADAHGLRNLLREVTRQGDAVVLAADQFEEVFACAGDGAVQLDRLLDAALEDADGPLHLVTTLRSDLVGRMALLPGLEQRLNQAARFYLAPMDRAGLREALLGPCARAGVSCEPGLLERVVADTAGLSGCLSLLGHALRSVYQARMGDVLTLSAYERIGGVAGALAQSTEQLLKELGAAGRDRARLVLLSLVRIGRGAEDTRRSRERGEVLAAAGGDRLAEQVLLRLSGGRAAGTPAGAPVQVRLIVLSGDRVELIHEALLWHMPALRDWVEEDRRLLEQREDLERTIEAWRDMGHPQDGLVQGTVLAHYQGERLWQMAGPAAREYLTRARSRERWRRRWRWGIVTAMVLVTVFAGVQTLRPAWDRAAAMKYIAAILGGEELDFARDHMSPIDGEHFYASALQQAEVILQDAPTQTVSLLKAQVYRRIGDLQREQGQLDKAEQSYRQMQVLLADREDSGSLVHRAEAGWRLAEIHWEQMRRKEAEAELKQAEKLLKQADPHQENLGFLYYIKGGFAQQAGDTMQAEAAYHQALSIQQHLMDEDPEYPGYAWHLGRILTALASLSKVQGRRQIIDRAVKMLEGAVAKDPGNRRYQKALADAQQVAKRISAPPPDETLGQQTAIPDTSPQVGTR